jgi:carbon monoxide dehydrogenase subunit G
MKMTGENEISASREEVWAALNDPVALKESIPGAEEVNKISDDEFTATVQAKVGPVRATFKGKIRLDDIDPPNGYTITGEGSGGAAGFAKGSAKVSLRDGAAGGTVLAYDVDAAVGGKLAQIGQRLIQGTAKKMADDFFANFAARFAAGPGEAAGEARPPAGEPEAAAPASAEAGETEKIFGLPRMQVVGVAVVVLALVLLFALLD